MEQPLEQRQPLRMLADSNITWTNALTVANNGNVGIATTNPADFKLQAAGHVGPDMDNLYDLGSASKRWRELYAYSIKTPVGTIQQQFNARAYHRGLHWDKATRLMLWV